MEGPDASRATIAIRFLFPALAAAWLGIAILSPSLGKRLLVEDGLVQWLQFALFFLAAALFFALAIPRESRRLCLALGLFSFLVAMEEISWGQRVFHFATPRVIEEFNVQDETTVHNLIGIQRVRHWGLIVFALAGLRFLDPRFRATLWIILATGVSRELTEILLVLRSDAWATHAKYWAGRFCEFNELGVAWVLLVVACRFPAALKPHLLAAPLDTTAAKV